MRALVWRRMTGGSGRMEVKDSGVGAKSGLPDKNDSGKLANFSGQIVKWLKNKN
jgi:hypothetical protein